MSECGTLSECVRGCLLSGSGTLGAGTGGALSASRSADRSQGQEGIVSHGEGHSGIYVVVEDARLCAGPGSNISGITATEGKGGKGGELGLELGLLGLSEGAGGRGADDRSSTGHFRLLGLGLGAAGEINFCERGRFAAEKSKNWHQFFRRPLFWLTYNRCGLP
jgi:hypothetical protein